LQRAGVVVAATASPPVRSYAVRSGGSHQLPDMHSILKKEVALPAAPVCQQKDA
jgi:hypothetical protein